jgi:hypothetical protein
MDFMPISRRLSSAIKPGFLSLYTRAMFRFLFSDRRVRRPIAFPKSKLLVPMKTDFGLFRTWFSIWTMGMPKSYILVRLESSLSSFW